MLMETIGEKSRLVDTLKKGNYIASAVKLSKTNL